ncbi:MAG: pentapeptide repeat-containing protein [Mycobacterium sp.]
MRPVTRVVAVRDQLAPDSDRTGRVGFDACHFARADLTGADLTGADLAGADHAGGYTGADHTGADYTGADHTGADHTGGYTGADLAGADHTRGGSVADRPRVDQSGAGQPDRNGAGPDQSDRHRSVGGHRYRRQLSGCGAALARRNTNHGL